MKVFTIIATLATASLGLAACNDPPPGGDADEGCECWRGCNCCNGFPNQAVCGFADGSTTNPTPDNPGVCLPFDGPIAKRGLGLPDTRAQDMVGFQG